MIPERFYAIGWLVFLQLFLYTDIALANDEGRAIYTSICSACHAPENVMVSSPKAGDTAEWNRRLAKGLEAVIDNAVYGFAAMPPKGGASELSREQIRLAIKYMAAPPASVALSAKTLPRAERGFDGEHQPHLAPLPYESSPYLSVTHRAGRTSLKFRAADDLAGDRH